LFALYISGYVVRCLKMSCIMIYHSLFKCSCGY